MSDIFISYKREEQPQARKLADALEREGWSVWWDPKLRAGEHFDDVIEIALKESKCVVVIWSKLSVNSRYVKDEASYALNRRKLVPAAIEEVELPFRFAGLHTATLIKWDGSTESVQFRKLIDDVTGIIGAPVRETRTPQIATYPIQTPPKSTTLGGDEEKPVHTAHIQKPLGMGGKTLHEPFDVFVSESAVLSGYFGVYGISSDQPDIQMYLSGGFDSIEEAIESANSLIHRMRREGVPIPTGYVVEYRKREDYQLAESYPLLTKDDLVESVTAHIKKWFVQLNKKTLLKGFLSYGNLILFGTAITIWIYWTDRTVTVPEIDLPIVGKRLSGKELNRSVLATYYPIGLFLLYSASFFRMLQINLSNDELRRKVLVLVKEHSWTLQEFAKLIAVSSNKGANPLFFSLLRWLSSNDLNSLTNLLKRTRKNSKNDNGSEPKTTEPDDSELEHNLRRWVRSDFDQRVHNLLYLDRDKHFRPAYLCFDPIIYLMMSNRTIFRLYSYLKSHGYHVHEIDAPQDPYQAEGFMPFGIWFAVVFSVGIFGGTCVWSILIDPSSFGWKVCGALFGLAALVFPNWWNYRAIIGRKGFPSTEPIGAYTIGPYAVNRLSLVGW
jgi:hypothetical protein